MDLYSDEETGVITHEHPAFDGFDTAQVDDMIKNVGGNDADAALRLQAVIKLLESAKTSVKIIESSQSSITKRTPISKQASAITLEPITSNHQVFQGHSQEVVSLVLESIDKFDQNNDGKLTMEEVVIGMILVATSALQGKRTKRKLLWGIVGLSVTSIVAIFVAAFVSKDTAVSNGVLTAKGGTQPLETSVHSTHIHMGEPAGTLPVNTEEEEPVKTMILGCLTPEEVTALKFGSLAIPATLTTESGEVHGLQVHDWKEGNDGDINILDTSSNRYLIKSNDSSCSSVVKHGRRLTGGGLSFNLSVDQWAQIFNCGDINQECCNVWGELTCPLIEGNCSFGTCVACGGNGEPCCDSGTECFGRGTCISG